MAAITRAGFASLDANSGKICTKISGLIAGEDLDLVSPCYIDAADGKVYMATQSDGFHGVNVVPVYAGQPTTLMGQGARFSLADGTLTPGLAVGLSASVEGGWDDADPAPVALCATKTDIVVTTMVNVTGGGS